MTKAVKQVKSAGREMTKVVVIGDQESPAPGAREIYSSSRQRREAERKKREEEKGKGRNNRNDNGNRSGRR